MQMSCVGLSCVILLSNGQLRVAIIRAASRPLYVDSDLSSIRVSEFTGNVCRGWCMSTFVYMYNVHFVLFFLSNWEIWLACVWNEPVVHYSVEIHLCYVYTMQIL